jgi:hypothetical protein
MYRNLVAGMAMLMILLGVAMIVVTLTRGFGVGLLLGALFVAAGGGRLWLLRGRTR